jgi:hypothetical protein
MTDDRDDFQPDVFIGDEISAWDAALNGLSSASDGGAFALDANEALHKAFAALLFGNETPTAVLEARVGVRAFVANDDLVPTGGFGRIMLERTFEMTNPRDGLPGLLDHASPLIVSNAAIASGHAANDNVHWVGSEDGSSGAYGRDPSLGMLDNGDALVAWVGIDGAIHAEFIPAVDSTEQARQANANSLDALIAALNAATEQHGGKVGRVSVTPVGHNSFATVWTCEFALNSVLMGKILTLDSATADPATPSSNGMVWTAHDLAPQSIASGVEHFAVTVVNGTAIEVSFATDTSSADGDGAGSSTASVRWTAEDDSWSLVQTNLMPANATDSNAPASASHAPTPPLRPVDPDLRDDATVAPEDAVTASPSDATSEGASTASATHHSDIPGNSSGTAAIETITIAGDATDTVNQTTPSLAISEDGEATVMHTVDSGAADSASIVITRLDEHGHADGAPVVVTDHALVRDDDAPTLDLGPAITGTTDGVAVVWIERAEAPESEDASAVDATVDATAPGDAPTAEDATDAATVQTLRVQVFDDEASPIGDQPIVIATSISSGIAFSDVATGFVHKPAAPSSPAETAPTHDDEAATVAQTDIQVSATMSAPVERGGDAEEGPAATSAPSVDEAAPASAPTITGDMVAVTWIAQPDCNGYGTLQSQLYELVEVDDHSSSASGPGPDAPTSEAAASDSTSSDPTSAEAEQTDDVATESSGSSDTSGSSHLELVALGGDGDDAVDGAPALHLNATGEEIIARSPSIEGLSDGALAVTWVEHGQSDTGADIEVVQGAIVTPGQETPNVDIDLGDLMPNGIAEGTEPVITSDAAGDLIIGWIQNALSGGYEAASAIYAHTAPGKWLPPSVVHILETFEELPRDFAISVSGSGKDMSLVVAWRDADDNVSAVAYDVDIGKKGIKYELQSDHDHNDGSGLALAQLGDGQMLAVYASSDGTDSDISGAIFAVSDAATDAQPSNAAACEDNSNSGSSSDNCGSGSGSRDEQANEMVAATVTKLVVTVAASQQADSASDASPDEVAGTSLPLNGHAIDSDAAANPCVETVVLGSDIVVDFSGDQIIFPTPVDDAAPQSSDTVSDTSDSATVTTGEPTGLDATGDQAADSSAVVSTNDCHSDDDDDHAPSAGVAQQVKSSESCAPPTLADVAALEALADDTTGSTTSSNSGSGSSGSGSCGSDGDKSSSISVALTADDCDNSGKGKSGSDDDDDRSSSGSGSGRSGSCGGRNDNIANDDDDGAGVTISSVANDNSTSTTATLEFTDAGLAFSSGYGNDIDDFITPEEQAALVPETITTLFDALQFANAFNDASNADVIVFDGANVVSITTLDLTQNTAPKFDIPLA